MNLLLARFCVSFGLATISSYMIASIIGYYYYDSKTTIEIPLLFSFLSSSVPPETPLPVFHPEEYRETRFLNDPERSCHEEHWKFIPRSYDEEFEYMDGVYSCHYKMKLKHGPWLKVEEGYKLNSQDNNAFE